MNDQNIWIFFMVFHGCAGHAKMNFMFEIIKYLFYFSAEVR